YSYNRFQACRFGLSGMLIDPTGGPQATITDDILHTFTMLGDVAQELGTTDAIEHLRQRVQNGESDAGWLRASHEQSGSLSDVVRRQSAVWMAQ
ncbi:MAG TPA: glutamate--cysteine ligase, partial [Herminiimonas sp.]|nr:glutamate--cysteine ligase [Herminiimonas sp.]